MSSSRPDRFDGRPHLSERGNPQLGARRGFPVVTRFQPHGPNVWVEVTFIQWYRSKE
jgi:hypothetical protein